MKFQIDRTPTWRWLLALLGATEARSFVDVREREVEVRFGFFHQTIPLAEIRGAEVAMRRVPWYAYSIGWRTNFAGAVGLIGAARNVVKLSLGRSRRVFLGLPVECRELYVSMENPDAFVAALQSRLRA
ncbi:MAG: hypothetical protein AB1730_04745 [Myxococcota bacterium]|jgi:hypothetical protein